MKMQHAILAFYLIFQVSGLGRDAARGFSASVSNGELKLVLKGVDGLEMRDYGDLAPITLYIKDDSRKGLLRVYEVKLANIFILSREPIKYKTIKTKELAYRIPIANLRARGFFDLKSGKLIGFSEPRHDNISRFLDGGLQVVEILGRNHIGTLLYRFSGKGGGCPSDR